MAAILPVLLRIDGEGLITSGADIFVVGVLLGFAPVRTPPLGAAEGRAEPFLLLTGNLDNGRSAVNTIPFLAILRQSLRGISSKPVLDAVCLYGAYADSQEGSNGTIAFVFFS